MNLEATNVLLSAISAVAGSVVGGVSVWSVVRQIIREPIKQLSELKEARVTERLVEHANRLTRVEERAEQFGPGLHALLTNEIRRIEGHDTEARTKIYGRLDVITAQLSALNERTSNQNGWLQKLDAQTTEMVAAVGNISGRHGGA